MKNELEKPKFIKEANKLKRRLGKSKHTRQSMEVQIAKIKEEKEFKMFEINNHGDKFTEIMDSDRHKNWLKSKELKDLKDIVR